MHLWFRRKQCFLLCLGQKTSLIWKSFKQKRSRSFLAFSVKALKRGIQTGINLKSNQRQCSSLSQRSLKFICLVFRIVLTLSAFKIGCLNIRVASCFLC